MFDPYGGVITNTIPATLTDRLFTGQRLDSYIKLIDYGARWYDAQLGRFVSPDTIIPDPANPQSWNRYAYVANNPVKYVDPSGHCWGAASGLRGTFYSTTCNNLDMAAVIVSSPDATVGQKAGAGAYIAAEAIAHTALAAGAAVLAWEGAVAATPYVYSAHAAATTAAAAHPTAAAVAGGVAETAAECAMTGGGCNVGDYALGAATAGAASRASTPSISRGSNPYQVRINPKIPGRPDPNWSIDTRAFSSSDTTLRGGIRNRSEFWKAWSTMNPNTLSKANQYRIQELGLSPKVDQTWIDYFPEHSNFRNETLIHHHVNQGPYAIPVPGSTHLEGVLKVYQG